jgi:hypothetical protein
MPMRILLSFILGFPIILAARQCAASSVEWETVHPGFRVTGLTTVEGKFWACGSGGAIASSNDGKHWEIRHPHEDTGPLLLGIGFANAKFGYVYGVAGTVLTTEDGGTTWTNHSVESGTILAAAFSAPYFGIVRTREKLLFFNGTATSREVPNQDGVLNRFSYVSGVASLNNDEFGALVREGEFSEGGFLTTTDGGATWTFYDPPRAGIRSFLSVSGSYWAVGHEVVNGGGIPLAMSSLDGRKWERTKNNIRACHWEVCRACNASGCIASSTLVLDPFHGETSYASIPEGKLTTRWAQIPGTVCTLNFGLQCVSASTPRDVEAQPTAPAPEPPFRLYRLGTRPEIVMGLVCIECAVDPSLAGNEWSPSVRADLVIGTDGTVKSSKIKGAPKALMQTVQEQVDDWLFEPAQRDGKPTEVAITIRFTVAAPRKMK